MSIRKKWAAEAGIAGRPLGDGPAVVGSGDPVVDLFPRRLADVVDEKAPSARLERESERVPQPKGPDGAVDAGGRREERIVRRDRSIRVDPEHLPEEIGQGLGIG